MPIVPIIFGCLAIIGGIFGKEFYAADGEGLGPFKQKVSTWSGRVVFVLVGVGLIATGIVLAFRS